VSPPLKSEFFVAKNKSVRMSEVDISGLDKVVLLKALWQEQKPAAFFTITRFQAPGFNDEEAAEAVKKYIDYFRGRAIKSDLSGDSVNPFGYDRDAGSGSFAKIVANIKN